MTITTTLTHPRVGDGFRSAVAVEARRRAEQMVQAQAQDRSIIYSFANRHIESLGDLANHVEALETEDPRLWCLWMIQGQIGGDTDTWNPTTTQAECLNRLGRAPDAAFPETTVIELIGAGFEDYGAKFRELSGRLQEERRRADRLEPVKEEADKLRDELGQTQRELAETQAESRQREANCDYLRGLVEGDANGKTPAGHSKPRRRKVEGHPGVYRRANTEGTAIYEIGWTEDGKQRWKTIGPDLDEAVAERERVTSPEPVGKAA